MSYGIVRIQKFSAGSVGGIQIHDKRLKEGISHTNQDIDWGRTDLNYNLAKNETSSYHQIIKKRISSLTLTKAVRKDAVVMAQCLVTSDKAFFDELSPGQTKKFFQESYEWLCERYGSENVISATVHMDERTPHMHFNFVPVTIDGRLSAKSLLTRQTLLQQHDEFIKHVGIHYGLKRGEQGGKKRHLDVAEYKITTSLEELKVLEAKKDDLSHEISMMHGKILSAAQIYSIRPKKGLAGHLKDITMDEFYKLQGMAIRYAGTVSELEHLKNEYLNLQNKTKHSLDSQLELISLQQENKKLRLDYDSLKDNMRRMEKTIHSDSELTARYETAFQETFIRNQGGKSKEKSRVRTR